MSPMGVVAVVAANFGVELNVARKRECSTLFVSVPWLWRVQRYAVGASLHHTARDFSKALVCVINACGESLVEGVFLAAGEGAQSGQVLRPWQLICGGIVEPTSNGLAQECCVWHDIEAIQRKGDATTTDIRHGSPTAIARRRTLGAYPLVQRHGRLCARDSMLMCVDCCMQRERAGRARTMQTTIINCGSVNTDAAPGEWSDKKSQQWRFEEQ